ncbi:MAG: maltokinase N-terminal cap-like domain-containing protein [Actinomycetes bacterium]
MNLCPPEPPTRNRPIDLPDLLPELVPLLPPYLAQQRWFAGTGRPAVEVREATELVAGPSPVLRLVVETTGADGLGAALYQLLLGVRPERPRGLLDLHDLGEVTTTEGRRAVYDALAHPETALQVGGTLFPDRRFAAAELQKGEQSNTSVVYDDRFILKVFRQLHEGANPDVEVTRALGSVGFADAAVPLDVWADGATDLGVLRTFERSSGTGASLAAGSIAALLEDGRDPRVAPGDLAADSRLLGATVARLHVALAEAFGTEPADGEAWARQMSAQLGRVGEGRLDAVRLAVMFDRLAAAQDLGQAVRIHGDLHLEQVLRLKRRWLVLDFEGEPDRPMAERRRTSSPLRDVAGMTRSYQYAAALALRERATGRKGVSADDRLLATMWVERNMNAFLSGYASVDEVHRLLPQSRQSRDALLSVFELDKAVYELAYELAHRPELADVPATAVAQMLDSDPPLPEFPAEP